MNSRSGGNKEANLQKKLKTDEDKNEEASPGGASPSKSKDASKDATNRGGRTQVKVRTVNENPLNKKKAKDSKAKGSKASEEEKKK